MLSVQQIMCHNFPIRLIRCIQSICSKILRFSFIMSFTSFSTSTSVTIHVFEVLPFHSMFSFVENIEKYFEIFFYCITVSTSFLASTYCTAFEKTIHKMHISLLGNRIASHDIGLFSYFDTYAVNIVAISLCFFEPKFIQSESLIGTYILTVCF